MAHEHPHPPHASHHGHAHGPAPVDFNRAFLIGIALNSGFVLIEAWYGWQINSLALLADAAHNLSDVAGLLLAWMAALAARLRPDARHTYGWRRASILAAFANAMLLLVAMGSLGWEALQRLGAPEPTEGWTIITVAAIGIVINAATALLFLRGREHDLNVQGAFLHMAADALISLGVVIGGALYLWQGWAWLDPVISLAIALLIVIGTWGLLRQSLHLLFDGVPEHIDLAAVQAWLAARPGVARVDDLHVWAMSTTQVALTAHLLMPAGAPGDAFLRDTSEGLREHFGIAHVTLQTATTSLAPTCAAPTV
ncbi:MAG: cation diffusion facilitator family transporter [Hylemonella sp.]|uniref:cation diffusion facilitator family transporter n=1 Tax=Hylemonella sp. TaxID=2066020 RepID=UPI0022C81A63|nr:cation diffusion facilitator family transporter [Hylemonella sp.]MCZ8251753.1 cation diffusion facilitator family transporter [Hylemonella sp.]